MDKKIRGCQEESLNDCITRKYINDLVNKCQCVPFQIAQSNQVSNKTFSVEID